MTATWDEIREFALTLPEVRETTHDGHPAVSVDGHMFARLEQDGHSVIIMCSAWEKQVLLTSGDPAIGSAAPREAHEFVVLHMDGVDIDSDIKEMLTEAWRIAGSHAGDD